MNISLMWNWLMKSSANPEETSLTVKAFLLGLVPMTMKIVLFACTFHVLCLSTTPEDLNSVANVVSVIVFLLLSIVSSIGFLLGLLRKIISTMNGTNAILNQ